jgi:hypothetical protein
MQQIDFSEHILNRVAMDLYANEVETNLIHDSHKFIARGDYSTYVWYVNASYLWGLSTTDAINAIVDAFRRTFRQVGV